jgi:hypothetical protein
LKNPDLKKEFVDPVTASSIGLFVLRSVAQAVIGWLGLEFLKKYFKKNKTGQKDEEINEKIS